MPHYDFPILPSTKVGALLDRYPELEDTLIGLAPAFKKLRNPLLRKGVAKVASLKHAAAVGGMPVNDLVNKLRAAVGQEALTSGDDGGPISYFSGQPEWFATARIVRSIDERSADPNKMPIVAVLQEAAHLQAGEILELLTTFLPAPGIEIMKRKGLRVWSVQQEPELIRTYVSKPCD
jgi:TusA-related sulfurtransferase